ncbi:MAG: zinc-dependent metalloprotease family protein [Pirellula sp.]
MKRRLECERLECRIALAIDLFAPSSDGIWELRPRLPATQGGESYIHPTSYSTVVLDSLILGEKLALAPPEFSLGASVSPLEITLPTPDHGFSRFSIVASPIMEPELAAQFPELRTFAGQGIDDPAASLRFDVTPQGFHAQVLSPNGAYYVDPFWHLDDSVYISYYKQDLLRRSDQLFVEGIIAEESASEIMGTDSFTSMYAGDEIPDNEFETTITRVPKGKENSAGGKTLDPPQLMRSGAQLRTYRAAVAATAEYTTFHGGTVANGQAAIVTAVNRVSGIYELELSVRLVLVANNSLLVYTNAATDPYTNGNPSQLISQNQTNIDLVIGNANYDIGHVFSTGGGGLAGLGVVGVTGQKARGETGTNAPIGDPFYVDYVAHEMGHQFAGNHTFNGTNGSCSGGNRNAGTAYEPGSGTTIQAYAGICGVDDLQPNSDPYFHSASFDEMVTYTTTGTGNAVATIVNTLNSVPKVDAGVDFVIPSRTPFALNAAGLDPDPADLLTYNWEERDLGAAQTLSANDNGTSPLFRSFNPVANPERVFPRLSNLINNSTSIGEKLPTTNRTLRFRATVRDNRSGGGGVNTDDMQISVIDTGIGFSVTTPNTPLNWVSSFTQTITWEVANTTAAPINTDTVNIFLSTDGGQTFPILLASNTANDGTHDITVPDIATANARVKIASSNSIFFDISNSDFTITGGVNTAPTVSNLSNRLLTMGGATGAIPITIGDTQTDPANLVVTATSSNAALIPVSNITLGGSGANRTISLVGASGQFGQATVSVNVTDGGGLVAQESFVVMFEKVVVCTPYQSFDSVSVPSLPSDWTTTATGVAATNWITSSASSFSAPNHAFVSSPSNISDSRLTSPIFAVNDSNSEIQFRNNYNLEATYDGGVLEISINGGGFADILAAGGSFKSGGYNGTLDTGFESPIGGRQAWTGNSSSYVDTVVNLPASAIGNNVQLRWRMGTDNSAALTGWRVDSIQTCGVQINAPATSIALSPTSSSLAENVSTVSATALSTISVTDDGFGTNQLSLSGPDAASFDISGNQLRLAAGVSLNFEAKATYNVTVNVDDPTVGGTPDQSVSFVLNVTNVNESPSISASLANVSGNVLTLLNNMGTWSDPETGNVDLSTSIGTVIKNANGTWSWAYTASSIVNNQTVTISATDAGGLVANTSFQLNAFAAVSGVNVLYAGSTYLDLLGVPGALETNKTFLRPGAAPITTSGANVVNYALGINGVVLDVAGLANNTLTADDFILRVAPLGASGFVSPSEWLSAPPPASVSVTPGTDTTAARVRIGWLDNEIQNTWLQIIVKSNANTGLVNREVFYIGHAMGDINGVSPYRVTAVELSEVQSAISTTIVPVTDPKDLNKDRRVTAFDLSFVQSRIAITVLLNDITIPSVGSAGEGESSELQLNSGMSLMKPGDFECFYSELGRKKLPTSVI